LCFFCLLCFRLMCYLYRLVLGLGLSLDLGFIF